VFQAVIHHRSDAVDFGMVEAVRVLNCHCGPFFLLPLTVKLEMSRKK
jgi:hypothetical protein